MAFLSFQTWLQEMPLPASLRLALWGLLAQPLFSMFSFKELHFYLSNRYKGLGVAAQVVQNPILYGPWIFFLQFRVLREIESVRN